VDTTARAHRPGVDEDPVAVAARRNRTLSRAREGALAEQQHGERPGLAGTVEDTALRRLRRLLPEVARYADRELVVDLAVLRHCSSGFARLLADVRGQCLARGADVELHDPPGSVRALLTRQGPAREEFAHDPLR
jgi:ABC-type transporter Mla MlaB component